MCLFLFSVSFQFKTFFKLSYLLITIQIGVTINAQVVSNECPRHFSTVQQQEMDYHMDIFQNPCHDFYEYACGNWRVKYPLRMLGAIDTLSAIKASNRQMLIEYLEHKEYSLHEKDSNEQILNDTTTLAFQLASASKSKHTLVLNLYKSCMEQRGWKSRAENELGMQYYIHVLKSFTPTWPILKNNYTITDDTINWINIVGEMRKYGVQAFFRVMVQSNWQLAQQLIFYIVPPTFEWLKRHHTDKTYDEDTVFLYQRYIKSLIMDLKVRTRKANQLASEIVEFEKHLLSLVNNEHSVVLREPVTLQNLFKEIPQIDLQTYFSTLLKDFELPDKWSESIMVVADKLYLESLIDFLNRSDPEIIFKYLLIQFLIHFEINLHDDESYTQQKMSCLQLINDFLPDNLSQLYFDLLPQTSNDFMKKSRSHLMDLFTKLKSQFAKMLNSSVVFEKDSATKLLALNKLHNMRLLIPEMGITEERVTHNRNISISSNNYHLNIINLWQLKALRDLYPLIAQLKGNKSINNTQTLAYDSAKTYGPLDINAYYSLKKNAIELPIGLLRPPFYHSCLKSAQLYGGFVYILAHELIHGFDYDGLNYDYSGTAVNSWGVKALIKFGVRSSCYLTERYQNGHININENIADTEGLRLALETYLDHEISDTFDVNDLKLFFISFAQTWCNNNRTPTSNNLKKSLHDNHKNRVNNVLGNFMEFSDIFKCKPGVLMHPEEKCRIW